MLNKFLNSIDSLAPQQQPIGQAPNNKRFRKKLYTTVAAIIVITVVLLAVIFVPLSNAEIISLGVHYSLGEKLTYDITSSSFSQLGESFTNSSAQSTLTIEVLSINGDTYTLNYTITSGAASNSTTTSHLLDVKKTDMINLLTLMPVALQGYVENSGRSPIETAFFNQSQAKVGDAWQIPVACAASDTPEAEITVKFVAIQNLAVKAGNFKVFKIEFTQASAQLSQNQPVDEAYGGVSGESYLEFGSCKQIQSTLQFNMTTSPSVDGGYTAVATFSSTLVKDENP